MPHEHAIAIAEIQPHACQPISILRNTTIAGATTPTFATTKQTIVGTSVCPVALTDVNGDGKPDIAIADRSSHIVTVLLNKQYLPVLTGSPASGTIVHDYVFAGGFG